MRRAAPQRPRTRCLTSASMLAVLRPSMAACIAVSIIAACGSVAPAREPSPEELVGQVPQSAFVQGDALYVRYAYGARTVVLVAAWPPDEPGIAAPYRV